eukprot:GHVT01037120.1.p1 GENE.GHVT01037120.1~~GHVT01037120.1.p1  ORF type:complete len:563 (-),score=159.92 GHVT01037120.1:643-2331(-)
MVEKTRRAAAAIKEGMEMECDDPYGDDVEEEEIVFNPDEDEDDDEEDEDDEDDDDEDDEDDDENDEEEDGKNEEGDEDEGKVAKGASNSESKLPSASANVGQLPAAKSQRKKNKIKKAKQKAKLQAKKTSTVSWQPGTEPLEGEALEYDSRAYAMLHRGTLDWSCLSFDVVADELGRNRSTFPHECLVVAGTQAERKEQNRLYLMKWSDLHNTNRDGVDSDLESTDEEDDKADESSPSPSSSSSSSCEDSDATLRFAAIHHPGTVNRVRSCPQLPRIAATWADTGIVHIWDLQPQWNKLENPGTVAEQKVAPKFSYSGHNEEGYALAWNPFVTAQLVTGSCGGEIVLWTPTEGGWSVPSLPSPSSSSSSSCVFLEHSKSSVEDLQWKPLGDGCGKIFASASVDRSIKVWDTRSTNQSTINIIDGHADDVNVIAWNPVQEELLLSGGDDGCTAVWDMRHTEAPVAKINFHKKGITSLDWHPTDEATFACSSRDNSISFWDLSVEPEDSLAAQADLPQPHFPDQLMFHHHGQTDITELKFHPQIPGVIISTAIDGFNIFKTFNI